MRRRWQSVFLFCLQCICFTDAAQLYYLPLFRPQKYRLLGSMMRLRHLTQVGAYLSVAEYLREVLKWHLLSLLSRVFPLVEAESFLIHP